MSKAQELMNILEQDDSLVLCNKFASQLQKKIVAYTEDVQRKQKIFINADKVYVNKRGKEMVTIDVGYDEGKFIYDTLDGNLYGIKSYAIIDRKKNFGNLYDIISKDFDWNGETIVKKGYKGKARDGFAGKVT